MVMAALVGSIDAPESLLQGQFGTASFKQDQSMVNTGKQLTNTYDPKTGKGNRGTAYYQDFHLETAIVRGPFSFQAEGDIVPVSMNDGRTPIFAGGYLFMTYFLTGEHRTYDRNLALFDRIKPKHPFGFGEGKGWGAWEVAARYSTIDLNSGPVRGGKQSDAVLGINWYLNNQAKIQFNYVHNWVDNDLIHGQFDIFETRFFIDF